MQPLDLKDKKGFLFDLDGCIYRGNRMIQGAAETIEHLRKAGKKILFLTNNSTKTPKEYQEKLKGMGLEVGEEEILTSSVATARYLKRLGPGDCYVVGEGGLRSALQENGFRVLEADEARLAKYVVCGLDTSLTYGKLAAACYAIQKGARLIATNTDPNMPVEDGYVPGAGAILSAIVTATGAKPTVIGKPSRRMMNIALGMIGLKSSEVVMVGDTLEIDITAAKVSGMAAILVLSGSANIEDVDRSRIKPDLVLNSVADLKRLLL